MQGVPSRLRDFLAAQLPILRSIGRPVVPPQLSCQRSVADEWDSSVEFYFIGDDTSSIEPNEGFDNCPFAEYLATTRAARTSCPMGSGAPTGCDVVVAEHVDAEVVEAAQSSGPVGSGAGSGCAKQLSQSSYVASASADELDTTVESYLIGDDTSSIESDETLKTALC